MRFKLPILMLLVFRGSLYAQLRPDTLTTGLISVDDRLYPYYADSTTFVLYDRFPANQKFRTIIPDERTTSNDYMVALAEMRVLDKGAPVGKMVEVFCDEDPFVQRVLLNEIVFVYQRMFGGSFEDGAAVFYSAHSEYAPTFAAFKKYLMRLNGLTLRKASRETTGKALKTRSQLNNADSSASF